MHFPIMVGDTETVLIDTYLVPKTILLPIDYVINQGFYYDLFPFELIFHQFIDNQYTITSINLVHMKLVVVLNNKQTIYQVEFVVADPIAEDNIVSFAIERWLKLNRTKGALY